MSWNPALDFFVEVKNEFIKECGEHALWQYGREDSFTNCLSYWVWTLENHGHPKCDYYSKIIEPLSLNESIGMLLIRYNDLSVDWYAYNNFYRECRSVVIDVLHDELVLTPFRKFFNINELEETQLSVVQEKIDGAARIEITDKLDGSMCSARWYHEDLIISGSQALDISKSYRLENYFHWMHQHDNAVQMLQAYPDYTFIFEGIFSNDVHVVQYDEQMFGLHLLGMRRTTDGHELTYKQVIEIAEHFNVPHVKIFNMTFEEVYQDALNNGRKANEGEGYVIDVDGQKYKLKYDDYVMIHKALCKIISPNAIIAAIREGRWDDFYSKIPLAYQSQAKEKADNIYKYVQMFDEHVMKWYRLTRDFVDYTDDRKTFMIAVDKVVPKRYQGAVRAKFLDQKIDYLHSIKYGDILDYIESIQTLALNIKIRE